MLPRLWLSPLVLLLTAQAWAAEPPPLQPQLAGATDQIIVKLRPTAQRSMMFSAETQVEAAIANVGLGIPASYERSMGGNAHVVQLPGTMSVQEAQDVRPSNHKWRYPKARPNADVGGLVPPGQIYGQRARCFGTITGHRV